MMRTIALLLTACASCTKDMAWLDNLGLVQRVTFQHDHAKDLAMMAKPTDELHALRRSGQATCTFNVLDEVLYVYYNGIDITSQVSGTLTDSTVDKTVTFTETSTGALIIYGKDVNDAGTTAGLVASCSSTDSNSFWNTVITRTTLWEAAGFDDGSEPADPLTVSTYTTPQSASGSVTCSSCAPTAQSIWTSQKFGVFRLTPAQVDYVRVNPSSNDTECNDTDRLNVTCGSCGPNWGSLNECKALCDDTSGCNFMSYFGDEGCRVYSACTPVQITHWTHRHTYERWSGMPLGDYIQVHSGTNLMCDGTRISMVCGECRPDSYTLNVCKASCDETTGCNFIVHSADNGCRMYSSCDTLTSVAWSVTTTIYAKALVQFDGGVGDYLSVSAGTVSLKDGESNQLGWALPQGATWSDMVVQQNSPIRGITFRVGSAEAQFQVGITSQPLVPVTFAHYFEQCEFCLTFRGFEPTIGNQTPTVWQNFPDGTGATSSSALWPTTIYNGNLAGNGDWQNDVYSIEIVEVNGQGDERVEYKRNGVTFYTSTDGFPVRYPWRVVLDTVYRPAGTGSIANSIAYKAGPAQSCLPAAQWQDAGS